VVHTVRAAPDQNCSTGQYLHIEKGLPKLRRQCDSYDWVVGHFLPIQSVLLQGPSKKTRASAMRAPKWTVQNPTESNSGAARSYRNVCAYNSDNPAQMP
jgi:hypothetical protein